ncbi:MAG: fibrobacter succinogenes major paralogous domain-containing protein [Chitinophagaceae bacterium]|nr:fibrobacter succinogenes major paralogous domain-containing protein [Chitinophagaceae bacterium]
MKAIIVISAILLSNAASAQTEVKIGKQSWMTANLNAEVFRNGDSLLHAKTYEEWATAFENKEPAWCYYDNDPGNGKKYGKLYNWFAVKDKRGLSPAGWHIPTDAEWNQLTEFLGGAEKAGTKMKSREGWDEGGNGTNSSGFSGLPGGIRDLSSGDFFKIGVEGWWWTTGDPDEEFIWCRKLNYENGWIESDNKLFYGYSVRCLRDQ